VLIGHERQIKFLERVLKERIPIHGFLFSGPPEVGKRTVALAFAKGLLCVNHEFSGCQNCLSCEEFERLGTHCDFLFLSPQNNKEIGIEAARQSIYFFQSAPQISSRKVLIIEDADRVSAEFQHAMLKTLEEPLGNHVSILVTAKPAKLFETIRSRLTDVSFRLVSREELARFLETELPREEVRLAAGLSLGRPGRAVRFAEEPQRIKIESDHFENLRISSDASGFEKMMASRALLAGEDRIQNILEGWLIIFRDQMLTALGLKDLLVLEVGEYISPNRGVRCAAQALRDTFAASILAEDTNVGRQLLLENLLLRL
jgi:DNA polymerase-3 subunit delta'